MPMADEEPEEEAGAPAWVVTFGDMMSILLTFFVMMLSFSVIDQVKFKGFVGSIKEAFGVQNVNYYINRPAGPSVLTSTQSDVILQELTSLLSSSAAEASVSKSGKGVLMTISGNLLFESGKAEIKSQMFDLLKKISQLLQEQESVILQVEGHTDSRPIRTARFLDNWDLSTARASSVVRYMVDECQTPPDRLAAAGYADSRPLVFNDSAENRERNRRVEFLFVTRTDEAPAILELTNQDDLPVTPISPITDSQ